MQAPAVMTRGMQLEAAVDSLPDWYFQAHSTSTISNSNSDKLKADRGRSYSPHFYNEHYEFDAGFGAYYGAAGDRQQLYDDLAFARGESALDSVDEDRAGESSGYSQPAVEREARPTGGLRAQMAANPEAALLASLTLDLIVKQQHEAEQRIKDQNAQRRRPLTEDDESSSNNNESEEPQSAQEDDGQSDLLAGKTLRAAASPEVDKPVRSNSSRRSTDSSSGSYADLRISGFSMRGREKSVMYHIDVLHSESQLQTYTIRRSYSDFKDLHSQLSEILDARQQYYRNRTTSRPSRPGDRNANQEREEALERSIMAFELPMLPHAGLLSFWKRHDRAHLQSRCQCFQELLHAILQQPFLRESFAMQKFLSVAPCTIRERGSSYVSLCEYSVPQLDREEEHRERRRRAQQYRRNSSASAHASMLVEY